MGSQLMLVFIVSFLALVHGYTPTFRNEATHPLKAPTESTLQMNEESSGRTNSNIQKQETYFSGGKHFEYMLLNGSNVLLTSLQNDSPYDIPPQPVSPKNDLSMKSNSHENTSNTDNLTQNETNNSIVSTKPNATNSTEQPTPTIINNFSAITKLKSSHNSTWFSVNTMPEPIAPKVSNRQRGLHSRCNFPIPNISSPTKLFSKHQNKSDENFASFTSPIQVKPMVSIYSDGSIPDKEEKPAQKQVYDYDDSFTKLLISNGILKPEDKENAKNFTDTTTSAPSIDKVYSKYPKKFNGSIMNIANSSILSTYSSILKDRRPSINTEMLNSSNKYAVNTTSNSNESVSTHLPVTSKVPESFTKHLTIDSIRSEVADQHEFSTKSSAAITSNSVGDLNVDESPRAASAESNTLSIIFDKSNKMYVEKRKSTVTTDTESNDQFPNKSAQNENSTSTVLPILKKNFFPDTMVFEDFTQTENSARPFDTKNLTVTPMEMSVKPFSKKPESTFKNIPSLSSFYPILGAKSLPQTDQNGGTFKNATVAEFKNLIEKSIKHLFLPVAKFFSNYKDNMPGNNLPLDDEVKNFKINIDDSKDVKVTLKSFTFTNLVDVLENESENRDFKPPKLSRFDRDLLQMKSRDTSFNWTDLNDGKNINLEDSINELFSQDDDVHWFVLLLAGNSTIAQMRKEDFIKYLKVNLAARLSLEYNDIKINAIIVVPPNLAVNVSLPANDSSVDVNEQFNLEESQKIDSIHELAETNATLLELSGQEYHVVQLLCLKSQQSVQNVLPQTAKVIERKHEDIEFYIFVMLGAICMFGVLSPILYTFYKLIQKRTTSLTFKIPDIFREKLKQPPHEKINESTCESLNVIFSEDFDRKYSSASWFDNTQHSSSILKPSSDVSPPFFTNKDEHFVDFCDVTRNPIENSPRLNKENKLNMLSCRPSCVLLPHQGRYPIENEYDQDKYFDNPNYNHDAR